MNFDFCEGLNILQVTVAFVVSTGVGDDQILWGGGGKVMVVASMYPASRIVIKPINCECTSILNNIILLRTL